MVSTDLTIILVDDDIDDRDFFSDALKGSKTHSELFLFDSGHKLIQHLSMNQTNSTIILFLDLNMPGMSGLDCLKHLKNRFDAKIIFTVIFSTSSSSNDIDSAYNSGANCYLVKPVSFSKLKELIFKGIITAKKNIEHQLPRERFVLNYN
ncbi:MAG: response regulator [Maribacter sp.]